MKKIPKYGNNMDMETFVDWCEGGDLIDYDGFGVLSTETHVSDYVVKPSYFYKGEDKFADFPMFVYDRNTDSRFPTEGLKELRKKYTHVCWFNK